MKFDREIVRRTLINCLEDFDYFERKLKCSSIESFNINGGPRLGNRLFDSRVTTIQETTLPLITEIVLIINLDEKLTSKKEQSYSMNGIN